MRLYSHRFNRVSVAGIVISLLLALVYATGFYGSRAMEPHAVSLFFIGYFVTMIYIGVNYFARSANREAYTHNFIIALSCFMWCGFLLNSEMKLVPDVSPFCLLVLLALFVLAIAVQLPQRRQWLAITLYFMYGIAMFMLLLFVIYFFALIPIGFIGLVALGMGGLVFLPVFCFVYFTVRILKHTSPKRKLLYAFLAGFGTVILFVLVKALMLNSVVKKVEQAQILAHYDHKEPLPAWIAVTKNMELSRTLEEVILYNLSNPFFLDMTDDDLFRFDTGARRSFEFRHNPFIELAYVLVPRLTLTEDEMLSVLGFYYNHNNIKEPRLWSGESVKTEKVWSEVMLYPRERLAYTETTLHISNTGFGNGEAIYTISMPPHSIVTSLSLWVNGIEEKAVLTSKDKAEKAYNNIVGVQQRDPSLVQWKEGNKVSLRVFPVSKEIPRKVKIGITSPLQLNGAQLNYTPVKITGQDIQNAGRMVKLRTADGSAIPNERILKTDKNGWWVRPEFADNFRLAIPVQSVSNDVFYRKGRQYRAMQYEKKYDQRKFSVLVLDVNKAWSKHEWDTIVAIKGLTKKVCYNNDWKTISDQNREELFDALNQQNFSLIPLTELDSNALVITKSTRIAPNFEDLQNADYGKTIRHKMNRAQRLPVFHLSAFTNDFWNTLNERKWICSDYGTTAELKALLEKNRFLKEDITDSSIDIPLSGLTILEAPANVMDAAGKGTDHLYRIYAYNKLMEDYSLRDSSDATVNKKCLDLAWDANVVSPISSLVVLETQSDYKNNAIDIKNNGLGNANMKNHGAVPEPHEWALIVIGAAGLLYYTYKRKKHAVPFKA